MPVVHNHNPTGGASKDGGGDESITKAQFDDLGQDEQQQYVEDPVGSGKYRKKTPDE